MRRSLPASFWARRQLWLLALVLSSLLQACGMLSGGRTPGPGPGGPSPGTGISRPTPPGDGGRSEQGSSKPGRIPDHGIDIAGSCSQTEEDGYREQATLSVARNQVQAIKWQLWVGKKGTCKFDLQDFRQTKSSPSIELVSRDGSACKLVIYQDPRRITLGFAECQQHCTGKVYDEAYPVMFDPQSGGCADLDR